MFSIASFNFVIVVSTRVIIINYVIYMGIKNMFS